MSCAGMYMSYTAFTVQEQFEDEMQTFLGGEDCPVFNNMYQYCQVSWSCCLVQVATKRLLSHLVLGCPVLCCALSCTKIGIVTVLQHLPLMHSALACNWVAAMQQVHCSMSWGM